MITPQQRQQFSLAPFYEKQVSVDGFPIVASAKVSDAALLEAAYLIERMLSTRNDLLQALVSNKVRFSIMSPTELTTDIPEHSDLRPASYWNRRARGLGATRRRPAVSCGEENLLQLAGDPYSTENILIHEFAHAIHEMALNSIDPSFEDRLRSSFDQAIGEGLWKDTYAATNFKEYWAEGVQSYFGTNRPPDHDHNHVDTRAELRAHDRKLFDLVDHVFRGLKWQYLPTTKRADQPHLKNFDRGSRPRFSWPTNGLAR